MDILDPARRSALSEGAESTEGHRQSAPYTRVLGASAGLARWLEARHDDRKHHNADYRRNGSRHPMTSRISTALLSAVVAASVSALLALTLLRPSNSATGSRTDDLYTSIRAAGVMRAGYAVGAPLFTVDPNTREMSGIFHDIVTAAAARLRLSVDWSMEVGYGEMIQGLESRRFDVVGSGVWINSDRAARADFTIPLYYDAVYAYARAADTRFTGSITGLNAPAFVISTMDGELGATIARADFPLARRLELPQNADFSQMILNVIEEKADVVFLAAGPARSYQAANPDQIVSVLPDAPVRVFPNALMIPQRQHAFRRALNHALAELLNIGAIDAILAQYEEVPGSYLRIAQPYAFTLANQ